MSIHVALEHVTTYRYDRFVNLGPQLVRLRPAPHCRTRILGYSLRILPNDHFINWQQDPQSNHVARLVFPERTHEFKVAVDLVAEMAVLNPFDFFLAPEAERFPLAYGTEDTIELAPFLKRVDGGSHFLAYLERIDRSPRPIVDFIVEINQQVQHDVAYVIRTEPGTQTPEETLVRGIGSCRDSSWLLVQLLHHLGLAARFVSGYLIQLTADQPAIDGPTGPSAEFCDLHAWCEVYLPGAGWIGLDPTSGLLAGEGHIPLACAPTPGTAAPISGTVDECVSEFSHSMRVERIWEAPRVTRPYRVDQWAAIDALGQAVDADLRAHDVRLTQGGEPTFVATDDPNGAEWNTDALGPTKRVRGLELLERLRAHYAPQGLVHCGQGKWYPGEALPRWSANLFWRADGVPMWREPRLLITDATPRAATTADCATFITALALRLGCDPGNAFPAYEDVWYYLWRERRLPTNVDPFDSRLDDPFERARLARVFAQGLDTIAGYVLPLHSVDGVWRSGSWFLRDERCYLLPGDSPLGLRLPLDSLPWIAPSERAPLHHPDPWAPRDALVSRKPATETARATPAEPRWQSPAGASANGNGAARAPRPFESASWVVRSALCVESRQGCLHVFLPPVTSLEAFLALVDAIEATADERDCPVVIEGYEPPRDPRLRCLRVTPDPGVLEVNVHPVETWEAAVEQTEFLYDAARRTKLSSEKFMLDGRHTGTGGGNHIVLGSANPADSPFLRRPDLLASMLAYWHDHPALSYLFSGLFVGPTSQAPRFDEGRPEAVHAIELAIRELNRLRPTRETPVAPWLIDRLFRHLLVDVTGNTHRAEFCIDKLYSPDSSSGRLGLLELRAFEMPPHPQMSLVQQLLLRALVARMWRNPYRPARLRPWGTTLHDRFMLPHFIWEDFTDVLHDLATGGYQFDDEWFAPHFEFRFPTLGDFAARSVAIELRMALEPWHVLGEENATGGTARYVDSSLERLQVRVRGLLDERHRVTCNRQTLPLHPTGTAGEFVAGIRYRAWQPPSCLHPTIGVHTPLTFDVVDTWLERSLGGCQYHVVHPGGRNYVDFPVNASAAEARRRARFFRMGHTPGRVQAARPRLDPHYPLTLDLRPRTEAYNGLDSSEQSETP